MLSWSLRLRTQRCLMINYPDLLAAAIIKQAVVDYKNFPTMRAEIKRFIKSEYFRFLTDVDPNALLEKIEDEYEKM